MAKKTYISPIIDIDNIADSGDHLLAGSPPGLLPLVFDIDTEDDGTSGGNITEAEAKATLFDYPYYFEDEDMWELASGYTMQ